MTIDQIKAHFERDNIHKIKLAGFDIDGVMRGKYISLDKFFSSVEKGLGFCDVIFGWDVHDQLYDQPTITGWHTGYPDLLAKIDLRTYRMVPWEPDTALFLLDFYESEAQPLAVSPRQLLNQVVLKANDMGFQPFMSAEYEYFIFRETPHSLQEKGFEKMTPLSPGWFGYSVLRGSAASEFVHAIIDGMRAYDVELEGIHTETGPGVYETAIRYDTACNAADKAALFKTGVKEILARHGLVATFMAKWSPDYPGCSGHLHQSLWNLEENANLFADESEPSGMSQTMKHYIAGQIVAMPDMMALICPTVNSYKRMVPGAWAPTNASWGIQNRTASIRAILGTSAKSTRSEYRLAGGDANPHIAMAASLAAGLYGIEHQLDPGEPFTGNAYEASTEQFVPLPRSLEEATVRLKGSEIARACLGDAFVDHFVITRQEEIAEFRRAITDWELKRYFEII
ncbi:MAG: glutamine synthetase family protein [Candidatus Poribacteria bacterium]|nr:glutamine synthetase family protein [Candidatus Poribacteria bacterium]